MYTKFLIALSLIFCISTTAFATNPSTVVVPQRIVQFDQTYFNGLNGYYTVGQQIAQEKAASSEDKLDKIANQLEVLIKILAGGQAPAPMPTPTPAPEPPKPAEDQLTTQINTLFKTKCYSCHANTNNGLQIFDKDGKVNVSLADAVNIHYRTEALGLDKGETRMPKGGPPLTNNEMLLVKKWLIKQALSQ